jgi:hypothetical protein
MPTKLISFARNVAQELWGGSACAASLMGHMRLRQLKDSSCLTNDHLEKTVTDWIPVMPPISLGDVSSFNRRRRLRALVQRHGGQQLHQQGQANNCTNKNYHPTPRLAKSNLKLNGSMDWLASLYFCFWSDEVGLVCLLVHELSLSA